MKVNNAAHTQEMSEKVLPGGHWMEVPGKFKKQAHVALGSVLENVRVLDGNVSTANINAATLRNHGKCHGKVFQGVTG